MIYLHATLQLQQGKAREFDEFLGTRFSPYLKELGANFVGSWLTLVGNQSEVTDLWSFEDAAQYESIMRTIMRDRAAAPLAETLTTLVAKETTKLMLPLRCSPLK